MKGFKELEFDLPNALLADLVQLFEGMKPQALTAANAAKIPNGQGVYQLFLDRRLVYVGKTDAKAGLSDRLVRHAKKITSRLTLDSTKVTFKAVRIYVFTAMDLERALIDYYSRDDDDVEKIKVKARLEAKLEAKSKVGAKPKSKLAWNNSGFGANDPGRKRDQTVLKKSHFDISYPIDLDVSVTIVKERPNTAAGILSQMRAQLPYKLRFAADASSPKLPHRELEETRIPGAVGTLSVRQVLSKVARALGTKWQITALPGYVIVYRERKKYAHGIRIS